VRRDAHAIRNVAFQPPPSPPPVIRGECTALQLPIGFPSPAAAAAAAAAVEKVDSSARADLAALWNHKP